MPQQVVQGSSIEEIRQEWAIKLNVLPENLTLEVIDKPGFFFRQYKVCLTWADPITEVHIPEAPLPETHTLTSSQAIWDGNKYTIVPGEGVILFRPFGQAGEVWLNGELQTTVFLINIGDKLEFRPRVEEGNLSWEVQVRGFSAVAKVKHERSGRYILAKDFPASEELNLAQWVTFESQPVESEIWNQAKLDADLEQLKVIHGRRPESWTEIMAVEGVKEVVVAVATMPVAPVHAILEDFISTPQVALSEENKSIDFFASKVQLVDEGTLLARKIPGKAGIPGKNVLGTVLASPGFKDFQFRLKKNVYLSEDGLEVYAECAGQPSRSDKATYTVENVYVHNKDVELATGSVEFPGDVFINGNVQDGLRVFAGGKLEIKGSVSHAEVRAEKGAKIYQNLLGGKIIVGEKFVFHSELLRMVSELRDRLSDCLRYTAELIMSPGPVKMRPEQFLKVVLERKIPELPKLASLLEKFILKYKGDELLTEDFVKLIQKARHSVTGLGPLEPQSLSTLHQVDVNLRQFIENLSFDLPEKVGLEVSYVQGATIECGGFFNCMKGAFNSEIRAEGDIKIEGVCRGGKIFAASNVSIDELGGSGVSLTTVQISNNSRLSVNYCHSNVVVIVGKEVIQVDEDCRKLEVFRENGIVQVQRVRENPL